MDYGRINAKCGTMKEERGNYVRREKVCLHQWRRNQEKKGLSLIPVIKRQNILIKDKKYGKKSESVDP